MSSGEDYFEAQARRYSYLSGSTTFGFSASGVLTKFEPLLPPNDSLLLRAVVVFGNKTPEGDLIECVAPPWFEIVKLLEHDPLALHQIDPRKLEEMIAGWYTLYGFDDVTLTPRSGDYGRDVIAVKHGILSVRIIDSVKRHGANHPVKADDVRSLLGVLSGDLTANKGVVTTTSDFAPKIESDPFIAPFLPHRLELVNGDELQRRLTEVANRQSQPQR